MNAIELTNVPARGESRQYAVLGDSVGVYRRSSDDFGIHIATQGERVANPELERWVRQFADGKSVNEEWFGSWAVVDERACAKLLDRMRRKGAWCYQSTRDPVDETVARRLYDRFAGEPKRRFYRLSWQRAYVSIEKAYGADSLSVWAYRHPPTTGPYQPLEPFEVFIAELDDRVHRDVIAPGRETTIRFPDDHPVLQTLGPHLLAEVDEPLRHVSVELDRP